MLHFVTIKLMIEYIKRILYFPIASYFRFFASIRLRRWNPRVIVVTGSNGKTTLLHMLEAQIGERARYSHHANSSYGIPFDILDLHRKTLKSNEWISFFLLAPFRVFTKLPKEKIYVVEADAYQPGVGEFIGSLLRPEVVLWISNSRTHSMNFDFLVSPTKFKTVEEAIAYEHGYFLKYCSKLVVLNGDSDYQLKQKGRTKATVVTVSKKDFKKFTLTKEGTVFELEDTIYKFPYILPEEIFYSIMLCKKATEYLNINFDHKFSHLVMPAGRGTVFEGIKDTTLIDSTYNANLDSIRVILTMFADFPSNKKWVVIGDMFELGNEEQEEHEKLADILEKLEFEKIILLGSRTHKYTYPLLVSSRAKRGDLENLSAGKAGIASSSSTSRNDDLDTVSLLKLPEARDYLLDNLKGGEVILFKGSQSMFLEGIIESLLKHKSDVVKLPRRGEVWSNYRKRAGL